MGKCTSSMVIFNSFLLNYQRVRISWDQKKSRKNHYKWKMQMITQDFMGPKKTQKNHFQLELSSCEHQLWFWFAESMIFLIFFPMRKIQHFLGNREILGFEKERRQKENWRVFFGKSKSHHVPWPEDGSSMVNQFFSIQWPEDGIAFNSKDPIQGPRSEKLKSVWVFPNQLMLSIESIESIHFSVLYLR